MKMAKASEADLNMAMDISNVLDDIERGYFPRNLSDDPGSEETEWIDTSDQEQYAKLIDGLKRLLNQGSISRVIWGMAVVCDPANKYIDPEADTIEHHPERQKMEDAMLWSLYHHQGSSSVVGQPIRKLLIIGQHDRLTAEQLRAAEEFGGFGDGCPPEETAVQAIVFFPSGSLGEDISDVEIVAKAYGLDPSTMEAVNK